MSNDLNATIALALKLDKSSFAAGDKALAAVYKDKQIEKAVSAAAKYAKRTGDLSKAQKALAKELKKRGDISEAASKQAIRGIEKEMKAMDRRLALAQRIQREKIKAEQVAARNFDLTRKRVELSGDVETQVRTLGGASQTFGLGGGRTSGAVGEVFAVIEAAPLLKASLAGMGSTVANAAKSIGIAGGAVGAALIIAAVGFKKLTGDAKKAAEALRAELDAKRAAREASLTMTEDEVRAKLESLQQLQALRQQEAENARKAADDAETALRETGFFNQVKDSFTETVSESNIETLEKDADKADKALIEAASALEVFNDELDSTAVIANTAREALLTQAEAAGERAALEQQITKLGVEGTQKRLEAIEESRQALQAELDVLQASGDTSQEVAQRMKALSNELGALGTESGLLENELSSGAAAARDMAEATKELSEIIEKSQATLAKKLADITRKTNQQLSDLRRKNAANRKKITKKASQSDTVTFRKAVDKRKELVEKARLADIKAAQKLQDTLRKIQDKGDDAVLKAIEQRDFLAFAQAKRDTEENKSRAIADAEFAKQQRAQDLAIRLKEQQDSYRSERHTRKQSLNEQLKDLKKSQRDQAADIRRNARRQRSDARRAHNEEIEEAIRSISKKLQLEREYWRQSIGLIPGSGGVGPSNSTNNKTINATFHNQFASGNQAGQTVTTILGVLQAG